ncbi:O-antigen ligase family protein [Flavobacterium collinsii]|uniref:TPR_REGION domain-containing protein n=1 Tax=Flavobacterium collinsii TaxID=1114861 RepID=A0A9W4TJA9_9FLAO|nr:O-antigen ligase family protein [Flavobacterium collinsii]CAA9198749.1 hypothetical protein FLACOL7796_02313 [Flavobacterium collinsii]CAI2768203.1 TPR_REGION domain-containing protein [Flavobacterium collinsii]
MTKYIKSLDSIFEILLLMIIAGGLLNINWFFNPIFASYYVFCLLSLVFIILTLVNVIRGPFQLYLNLPSSYLGLWCLYILLRNTASKLDLDTFLIYMSVNFLLIVSATTVFNSPTFNLKRFFSGIMAIAAIESCYCILQYLGFIRSKSEFFIVTGTWINPNVTAQFLAMCVPVFLYSFKNKRKKIYQGGFALLLIALILLKCRAAFIGTLIATIVYFTLEYSFISWVRNQRNKTVVKAFVIIGLFFTLSMVNQLYISKIASSQGRTFIWKLSSMMITEKPVFGYGYGLFEKEYNLYQANYIKKGKASLQELQNAGPTTVAQNEFLQNAVEGGLIGVSLMLLFLGSLIIVVRQKKNNPKITASKNSLLNLTYAAILSFVSMAMVNFTIQSVPAMTMLSIFAALLYRNIKTAEFSKTITFQKNASLFVCVLSMTITLCLSYRIVSVAFNDTQNKKAFLLKKEGKTQEALLCIKALESVLKSNRDYWKNYAGIYFQMMDYGSALKCLERAKITSANPELYLATGVCHEKLQQYPKAIQQYNQLVLLQPSKFAYRFQLMNAYMQNKDSINTIAVARQIIDLYPKIPSQKVTQYKKAAYNVLNNFNAL